MATGQSEGEISRLTAVELRGALMSGALSSREVTAHFLSTIEAKNKQLGAFITVTAEQAMDDAHAADNLRAKHARGHNVEQLPMLHGMPIAFKDLTDVAGVPTTHGSAALGAQAEPPRTAPWQQL